MYNIINEYRLENNLTLLKLIPNLESAAKDQALYMCEERVLTHDNPIGSLRTRSIRHGFKGTSIGENIAKTGNDDFKKVVEVWMKSLKHKKNILGNFTYTGIATCLDKESKRYWVQVFGSDNDPNKTDDYANNAGIDNENEILDRLLDNKNPIKIDDKIILDKDDCATKLECN